MYISIHIYIYIYIYIYEDTNSIVQQQADSMTEKADVYSFGIAIVY